jgi:hypothetical protein
VILHTRVASTHTASYLSCILCCYTCIDSFIDQRACIPDSDARGADAICYLVRELLLVELVGRTLKNVLREFQRRWMRSEQSTSDGVSVDYHHYTISNTYTAHMKAVMTAVAASVLPYCNV